MERIIKFRAWDTRYSEPIMRKSPEIENHINHDVDINSWFKQEGLIFMQYTWLKDKNGKEIYEGDIVNLFPEYDDMEVAYEILYNWCSFKINCWSTPYNNNLEEINYKIEVIWNIYENPELLNK